MPVIFSEFTFSACNSQDSECNLPNPDLWTDLKLPDLSLPGVWISHYEIAHEHHFKSAVLTETGLRGQYRPGRYR